MEFVILGYAGRTGTCPARVRGPKRPNGHRNDERYSYYIIYYGLNRTLHIILIHPQESARIRKNPLCQFQEFIKLLMMLMNSYILDRQHVS